MVFVNEEWNDTGDIVVYSNYHKYWLDRERKIKNPLFDVFSGRILDLKEGKQTAINYFYNLLNEEICEGVTIQFVSCLQVMRRKQSQVLENWQRNLQKIKESIKFTFYNGQNLLTSWHGADGEINRSIWRQSLLLKIWILRITSFC